MLKEAETELKAIGGDNTQRKEVAVLWVALLHERRKWRRLRTLTQVLVQREPEEASWWVSLAYASRRITSVARARKILLAALKHHPDEAVIHFNLGCYDAQSGDLDQARSRVRRAIKLEKAFAEAARTDPDLAPLRAAGREIVPDDAE